MSLVPNYMGSIAVDLSVLKVCVFLLTSVSTDPRAMEYAEVL